MHALNGNGFSDMKSEICKKLKLAYKNDPDVYYFSFSTYASRIEKDKDTHRPDSHMSFHLWSTSFLMGHSKEVLDSSWYENDGICNTISMTHPFGSLVKSYDGVPQKGVWQSVSKLHMDHQAVIGHMVTKKELNNIIVLYNNHATLLSSLK